MCWNIPHPKPLCYLNYQTFAIQQDVEKFKQNDRSEVTYVCYINCESSLFCIFTNKIKVSQIWKWVSGSIKVWPNNGRRLQKKRQVLIIVVIYLHHLIKINCSHKFFLLYFFLFLFFVFNIWVRRMDVLQSHIAFMLLDGTCRCFLHIWTVTLFFLHCSTVSSWTLYFMWAHVLGSFIYLINLLLYWTILLCIVCLKFKSMCFAYWKWECVYQIIDLLLI